MIDNRKTYETSYAVHQFAKLNDLQAPEKTIFEIVQPALSRARMLDLGVGAGRTTVHFAPRAKEYVGADYSQAMIDACRERFAGDPYRFEVADARQLPFEDRSFDIVLFSYNGIDYVPHEDRQRVLREVHRVLRDGGTFAFSTHNLDNAPALLSMRPSIHPRAMLRQWKLRLANPPLREIASRDWIVLHDGALDAGGGLETYYVRREEQLRQLAAAGFIDVQVFQLDGATAREGATDPWLYYLCKSGLTSSPRVAVPAASPPR
ncbi:MAG TPA: class I SAM-dependent methyltransferase [Thermoanaerobaculia bacterium]|nr:class I SAM-dependent methyltransferase [Thermoanaerobaculia bacterium]